MKGKAMGDGPPEIYVWPPRSDAVSREDRSLNPMIDRQLSNWRKVGAVMLVWMVINLAIDRNRLSLPPEFWYGVMVISAWMCGIALSMVTLCALEPKARMPAGSREWQPRTSGIFLSLFYALMPALFLVSSIVLT